MSARKTGIATLGALLLVAGAWVVYGSVQVTNTQEFCTSCHAMQGVTEQYRTSIHYKNSAGLRARCSDCHIPPGVVPVLESKVHSLYGHLLPWITGIKTPEQVAEKRVELARRVWDHMLDTDSATCRTCHDMTEEVLALQERRAREQHESGIEEGQTCIECHDDGVAHEQIEEASAVEKEEETDFSL